MGKFTRFIILILLLIAVHPCFADDSAQLLGTWRLVSYQAEFQATGEREDAFGKNPTGYQIFTPEGRTMMMVAGEGRKTPTTDQDRANLWKSMIAFTGMYRVEGDKFTTKVDTALAPALVGTELVRFYRFDGDRLHIISAWMDAVLRPEKGKHRTLVTWERVK